MNIFTGSILRLTLGACAAAALAQAALAAPPPDLDDYANHALSVFGAPGMAVAIVEGDTITARAYGVRRLGSTDRVDAHTTFPIGSNTKAFTATAIAILVDQGKLDWNDRVVDRLPGFQMWDAYASHEMTVVDLLTHRSGLGLGEGDLMFAPTTRRSRAELVHALRYLKPATSFRSGYAYDNVLYSAAGELIGAVSGQTWEEFVKARIFAPLGMSDAAVSAAGQGPDHASLHARTSEAVRGLGPLAVLDNSDISPAAAPAGAIFASASDMGRWLRVQLNHGQLEGGQRLFTEAASDALWTPRTIIPITPAPAAVALIQPDFEDYGLGFFIEDYRGHKIITHSGAILGGLSALVIVPEKHVAFAVMINSEDSGARWAVFYRLLDYYLGLPSPDWTANFKLALDKIHARGLASLQTSQAATHPERGPSLSLAGYTGLYRDPWYGTATISASPGGLRIRFDETPGMEGPLEHVQYDTFRAHWTARGIEDAYVTFSLDPKGAVSAVRMEPVSPLADFSFDYQDLHFEPVSH